MGRQIWITDEAVARVLFVKGRSGVDPDCLVAYLEGDDSKPLWIVDGGRGGKVSSAYVCGLGTDSKVRARCIGVTRMEICADCGKEIGMLEPSYYRKGDDDIGRAYHATCGDPYGLKAKDAEIERLRAEVEQLKRRPSASDIDPTAGVDPHWNWGRGSEGGDK